MLVIFPLVSRLFCSENVKIIMNTLITLIMLITTSWWCYNYNDMNCYLSWQQVISILVVLTVSKLDDGITDARSVRVNIRNHPYIYQIANPSPIPDPISGSLLSSASDFESQFSSSSQSVPTASASGGSAGFRAIPIHPVRGFSAEATTTNNRRQVAVAAPQQQITVTSRNNNNNNVRQAVRRQQPQQFTPSFRQEFTLSPVASARRQPTSESNSRSAEFRQASPASTSSNAINSNDNSNTSPVDETEPEAEVADSNVHTPYKISYDSVDANGTQMKRDETKDDKGVVRGSYRYLLLLHITCCRSLE